MRLILNTYYYSGKYLTFAASMIIFYIAETIQECFGIHAFLAAKLYFVQLQPGVTGSHQQVVVIDHQLPWLLAITGNEYISSLEYFQNRLLSVFADKVGPCTRIGSKPAYEVMYLC